MLEIIIQGELTDLNKYINAERRNRFIGAKIKKDNTNKVIQQTLNVKPFEDYPAHIHIDWYTKNSRVDPDNSAFSLKFFLDGLVENKILIDDSRKFITSLSHNFFVD